MATSSALHRLGSILFLGCALLGGAAAQDFDTATFDALHYRCIGPSRGGRVTTVAGVVQEPGTFYMGATGGGVWKTTDFGQQWRNVSDGHFATASIGAIRVAPSNPDVVWAGTGSDGLRSNVITGRGVYRSTNAGRTWSFLGLREVGQIGAVEVHPTNPDIAWVAAIGHAFGPSPQRGVYKTKDGGKTWDKVLFISETCGAVDLELAPDDPNLVYACVWRAERKPWTIISGGRDGGLFRSDDGGESWEKVLAGLPKGVVGKSDLAVSLADPKRVYLLIEAHAPDGGLYRSDDHGKTFELVSTQSSLLDRPFYYCNIDANPSDADDVFVSATGFHRSTNGGRRWGRVSTPHGDNHDIWIHPKDGNLWVQANDGGANVTRDGGRTWSTQHNQPTAELYQVEVDDRFPYWVYAGQQDNSTIRVPSLPPWSSPVGAIGYWQSVGGCETGPAVPKPGDPDIVYANCKGKFSRFNFRTGQQKNYYVGASNLYGHNPKDLQFRFQRVSPIHISPHDPGVVYHASQYLHRTRDEGVTWETISPDLTAFEPDKQVISGSPINRDITGEEYYSTIYSVRESAIRKGVIWVGANDGPVHVTKDGGKHWQDVTPSDLPSGGRVQCVEPSPHDAAKAYVAVYRFLLGDWQPYVYRTNDYGASWTRLTTGRNGIPADTPTRVVREDPDRAGLLYVGTEFGMFVSFDDGGAWTSLQRDLPVTPITDIKVHRKDLVLSTMGRSFWILDDLSSLHQIRPGLASRPAHLFKPRDAYRMRYRPTRGRGVEYPSPSARIDYWVPKAVEGSLTLEIVDSSGQIVRTFSSGAGARRRPPREGQGMRGPRSRRFSTRTRLETTVGLHRLAWDLRGSAPASSSGTGAGGGGRRGRARGGPTVVPGDFTVRLKGKGWSQEQPLRVLLDPRVVADGVTIDDLKELRSLQLRVTALRARASATSRRIRSARRDLADAKEEAGADQKALEAKDRKLVVIQNQLDTQGGRYPRPMLVSQVGYLASMLGGADQKPGRDAYQRLEGLTKQLDTIDAQLAGER
ncbi:MAG: hypothetical protein CMJ83_10840 [Planctomycetes bacterium]|nr:hypothetical protein [Planctomycetota bacterium]